MGTKLDRPLLDVGAVRVGKTAFVNFPTDPRYFSAHLAISATGQVLNQIVTKFRLKLGTKVQWELTPDELDYIYQLYARNGDLSNTIQNNVAGQQIDVPFWFAYPDRKSFKATNSTAWATGDVDKMVLEADISPTADASVDLTASAVFDNPVNSNGEPMPMGLIEKYYEDDIDVTGSTPQWKGLDRADDLNPLHFFDPDIDKVELIVGGVTVREVERQKNTSKLTGYGMSPSSDVFSLVLVDDDDPGSALPLSRNKLVVVKLTLSDSTPRSIRVVAEKVGPRD